MIRTLGALCLLDAAWAQKPGTEQEEGHPSISLQSCTGPGSCSDEPVMLTLDAQRRWLHDEKLTNCFEGEDWDGHICSSSQTCASKCMLEGVPADDYSKTYGVSASESGVEIKFIVDTEFGKNVGSRLYVMDGEDTYKIFQLKNREIAFEVDVNSLPCGLNAALYLVEMPADGGKSSGTSAGAKYGTGYCDAQCPHALKFIKGEANLEGWKGAIGGMKGSCCAEMDLFEANKMAGAFTAHPCSISGDMACTGQDCGDADAGHYYQGVCDKDGCDYNPYRLGAKDFYGPGLTLDPQKPFTVVTQFLTVDGSDGGDLAEIRQVFVQNGQVIEMPESSIDSVEGNSITNAFCASAKEAFHQCRVKNNPNGAMDQFNKLGGLKAMGEAIDRGMVLVLSLWDDPATAMHWLDSSSPSDLEETVPGVLRGPCPRQAGKAEDVEASAADAMVRYSNIKYGAIGATTEGVENKGLSEMATAPMPDTPKASAEKSTDGMSGFKNVKPAFEGSAGALPTDNSPSMANIPTGTATAAATLAPGTFACDEGLNNWELDWSIDKKTWCCENYKKGCVAPGPSRLSSASLPSVAAALQAPAAGLVAAGLVAAAAFAAMASAWRRASRHRRGCLQAQVMEMEEEPLVAA